VFDFTTNAEETTGAGVEACDDAMDEEHGIVR
jgi:hypothetical protein